MLMMLLRTGPLIELLVTIFIALYAIPLFFGLTGAVVVKDGVCELFNKNATIQERVGRSIKWIMQGMAVIATSLAVMYAMWHYKEIATWINAYL